MKFWIRNGFLRIVGYSEAGNGFLDINLEKTLITTSAGMDSH